MNHRQGKPTPATRGSDERGFTLGRAADTPLYPTERAFVIRIGRDLETIGPDWSGRIEHITSGRGVSFEGTGELLEFIRRNFTDDEKQAS